MFLLFEHVNFIFSSVCNVVNKSESGKKGAILYLYKYNHAGKWHKYSVIKILFLLVR